MKKALSTRRTIFHSTALALLVTTLIGLVFAPTPLLSLSPDGVMTIVTGKKTFSTSSNSPPLDQDLWSEIRLPDQWISNNDHEIEAWYFFQFKRPIIDDDSFSIYIPSVRRNLTLTLNGERIFQAPQYDPQLARLWYHPQLITLPASALKETNKLHLRFVSDELQGGHLSKIYVGPSGELSQHWRWRKFAMTTWLEIVSGLLILVALINLYLWCLRPNDTYYCWYALAALCWGTRGFLLVLPEIPISDQLHIALRLLTLGYGIVFVVLFNQRYFGFKNRAFDIAILVYCIPAALPMLFMNTEQLMVYGHQYWVKGNLALGLIITLQLLYIFYKQQKPDAMYLLYSGLPLLILGYRDLLVLTGRWSMENAFLINHATLPAMVVAMWFILRRLSTSLEIAELTNVTLEQRVTEKEAEIKQSYQQQAILRRQQLLNDERERMMQDMHDGMGGHLIGLKSLLDSKSPKLSEINRYADKALVDLRLVINSLDPASQNLSSLLGSLRRRWQRLADNNDQPLDWQVSRTTRGDSLGPERTLQIMRILEEAFTNSVKHGSQGTIEIRNGYDGDHVWISISNSITEITDKKTGRGLVNMQRRASRINAKISFETKPDQFITRLEIPL